MVLWWWELVSAPHMVATSESRALGRKATRSKYFLQNSPPVSAHLWQLGPSSQRLHTSQTGPPAGSWVPHFSPFYCSVKNHTTARRAVTNTRAWWVLIPRSSRVWLVEVIILGMVNDKILVEEQLVKQRWLIPIPSILKSSEIKADVELLLKFPHTFPLFHIHMAFCCVCGGHRKIPWWSCHNAVSLLWFFPISSREHTSHSAWETQEKMFLWFLGMIHDHRRLFCSSPPVGYTQDHPPSQALESISSPPHYLHSPFLHSPEDQNSWSQLPDLFLGLRINQNLSKAKHFKNKTLEAAFCWLHTALLLCCLHLYLPANYFQFSFLSPKRFPSKSTSRETFCCPFLNLTTSLFLILLPLDNQSRPTHIQASASEGRRASSTKWLHPAEGRSSRTIWASLLPHPWIPTSSPAFLVVFVGQTHPVLLPFTHPPEAAIKPILLV